MKKQLISGVIILMVISLIGIILVQWFWIKNAIEVKQAQFDRSVNDALLKAIDRIETDENVFLVSNMISGQQKWKTKSRDVWGGDSISTIIESSNGKSKRTIVYVGNDSNRTVSVGMHGSTGVFVGDGTDENVRVEAIIELDSLKEQLHGEKSVILSEFQDSLNLIVQSKISQLNDESEKLNNVIEKMIIEIEDMDDPLEDRLDTGIVKATLNQSLIDTGIGLPFEFAVYDPKRDSILPVKSSGFSRDNLPEAYKTRLFSENIFNKPEMLMVSFEGEKAHVLKSLALLLTGSGILTLLIILTFAITLHIILKQKKLSAIKSDFINNMTHEFKTPIATISLAVDSINNPKTIEKPDKVKYFTNIIGEENKRMNSRVESVLQMSLIDNADFDFRIEETNVHDIIMKAANNVELLLKRENGRIQFKLEAKDIVLMTDKSHLLNIFVNLLENAIKYSATSPEITIGTKNMKDGLFVEVEDMGVGMTKEEQGKIFDKFYRIPTGDIHNVKGFGLGLSYVKAVVLALGGEIGVDSEKGKGSVFTVLLPV